MAKIFSVSYFISILSLYFTFKFIFYYSVNVSIEYLLYSKNYSRYWECSEDLGIFKIGLDSHRRTYVG